MHAVARNGPLLGLVLSLLLPLCSAWAVTAAVGQPAPEISLPSIRSDDESIRLSDHRGKVVLLDFWSSWCAPCRRAMPHLDALREEFPRNDFEVIAVNVDPVIADGRRFLEQVSVSYPVAADTAAVTAERYGVATLPVSFLIDRAGVVRHVFRGSGTEEVDRLRATLEKLIGGGGGIRQ